MYTISLIWCENKETSLYANEYSLIAALLQRPLHGVLTTGGIATHMDLTVNTRSEEKVTEIEPL